MSITTTNFKDGVIRGDMTPTGASPKPSSSGCSCRYCGGSSWDRKKRCDGCGAPFPADKVFLDVDENLRRQEMFRSMERARGMQNSAHSFGAGLGMER